MRHSAEWIITSHCCRRVSDKTATIQKIEIKALFYHYKSSNKFLNCCSFIAAIQKLVASFMMVKQCFYFHKGDSSCTYFIYFFFGGGGASVLGIYVYIYLLQFVKYWQNTNYFSHHLHIYCNDDLLNPYRAGIYFSLQNLTAVDVRFMNPG